MRCRRPSATPCAAATPGASSGFEPGHDLATEQLERAHGVLRREVAEGEDAEKIVRSGFPENLAYLVERGARRTRDERVHRFRGIRLGVVHIRAAELAGQMVDVARPLAVRFEPKPFRFGLGLGDDHVQRPGEEWRRDVRVVAARIVPVLLPDVAVALEERLAIGEPSEERRVIAVLRGELDGIAVAAGEPEGRIRLLHGLVVKLHVLALVVEDIAAAGSKENVERLAVAGARLLDALHSINQGFDGRNAATHAELEPAARELVEHADFVVEAVRVVPGQAEGERAEAQAFRALDHRREQHARRRVDRERRALVLGDEVGMEAGLVRRGGELQLVLVDLAGRQVRGLDPVEDSALQAGHRHTCRAVSTTRSSLRFWSSSLTRLPTTSEPKPHCGLRARFASGTNLAASSIRRLSSSTGSSRATLVLTSPSTTILSFGTKRKGAKLPARGLSYSSRKRWCGSSLNSRSAIAS